jgi:hypothetical protein
VALVEFVVGNVLFVATHEMGHALLSEMKLPVLGGEEQAADDFAILTALKHGERDFSDRILIEAAKGWFVSGRRDKKRSHPPTIMSGMALDLRRGYRIVCLMIGADPVKFKALAEETMLPKIGSGPAGTYIDMMRHNTRLIANALKGPAH